MSALLIIIGVFVIVVCVFAFQNANVRALNATYERVATSYDGHLERRATWAQPHPVARFVHHGVQVTLNTETEARSTRYKYTQLQLSWPDDGDFRCEVFPRRFFNRLGRLFGHRDMEVGTPAFDREYVIRGTSQQHIRDLISPQVQISINRLRDVMYFRDLYVSWSTGVLLIKVRGLIRDYSVLRRFTSLGLELYENAISSRAEGIEFVNDDATEWNDDAVCPVCGEQIRVNGVYCRSCKTPHHRDCWKYFGACAIYGCGQKKFSKWSHVQRLPK